MNDDTIEGYDFGIYSASNSDVGISESSFCNNMIDFWATSDSWIYGNLITMSYDGAYIGPCGFGTISGYCSGSETIKDNRTQIAKTATEHYDKLREANLAFRDLLKDKKIKKEKTLSEESKSTVNHVIGKYLSVLFDDLSKSEEKQALRKLSACYSMLDEETIFADYVTNLIEKKSFPSEMKRFLIPNLVSEGSYNQAINLIDEISAYQDISQDLKYELLYEKGTIQKYYLNEVDLSEKVFAELYKTAGDHILAKYAKAQLNDEAGLDGGNKPIAGDNADLNNGFAISSYPNPFNPTTTIEYQIPKDGLVNLVVYNTLGQVVAELVNEHQSSGKYSVQFNASNLPSGIYFYKIESGGFTKSMKMILLK